jgi:hypothetical protein
MRATEPIHLIFLDLIIKYKLTSPHYHYFDIVVVLASSYDPQSYAGGSVAAGTVSHTGGVTGDDPDKERNPGPPVWGLGMGLTTPSRENT